MFGLENVPAPYVRTWQCIVRQLFMSLQLWMVYCLPPFIVVTDFAAWYVCIPALAQSVESTRFGNRDSGDTQSSSLNIPVPGLIFLLCSRAPCMMCTIWRFQHVHGLSCIRGGDIGGLSPPTFKSRGAEPPKQQTGRYYPTKSSTNL